MNKLFASSFLTFALSAAVPQLVYAQESNSRQYGTLEGQNDNHDYESVTEGELNGSKNTLVKQDSAFSKSTFKRTSPEAQKASPKKSSGEDEAPFNFLYYIIQRFKTSDIIED